MRLWLTCVFFSLVSVANAQTLEQAVSQLQDAQVLLHDAATADDQLAALTTATQAYQRAVTALRAADRELALRQIAAQEALTKQEAELSRFLGALTTISRTEQPAARVHPSGPLGAARAGMLVAELIPAIEAKVAVAKAQVLEITQVRQAQADLALQLENGLATLADAQAAVITAAREADHAQAFVDAPIDTALMVANAGSLQEFAQTLRVERPEGEATVLDKGNLALPVAGQLLPDDDSGRSGIRLGTAAQALVTAPATATVLYQGEFLDYGQIVMLEPAPDVLFVLAGLAEVVVQTGDILPKGAPIGLVSPDDDGILSDRLASETGQIATALYLEVREGQTPVDPGTWFALEN